MEKLRLKAANIEKDELGWIWLDGDGVLEKHDGVKNLRNGQTYSVHTESPYKDRLAVWTGPGGDIVDLIEGDELQVVARIRGEYDDFQD